MNRTKLRLGALAFGIPLLTLLLLFIAKKVYPFGEECILHVDMYHQYVPFTAELQEKLKTFGSPFFSWNLGLGSDFLATYAYYLASPLNLILGILPRGALIEGMTFLIAIKVAISSLAEYLYLSHLHKRDHVVFLLPSLFYAFSGFFCAYYWDIMWLDPVALFPLILLGMERLVKEKRFGLYVVTLSLAIWSNYYISIMICIFLVFWFFLTLPELSPKGKRLMAVLRMGVFSCLSAGISAVLILPEIAILGISGSGDNHFPTSLEFYYNPLEGLTRGFFDVPVTTTEGKLPNIYCGVFALFLLVLYLLNKNIPAKKKIKRLLLLAFLWLSFMTNVLEFIWHGFHFPEGLPARQSFLFVFLLLSLATDAFMHMQGNDRFDICVGAFGVTALCALLYVVVPEELFDRKGAILTILFLVLFILLYVFVRKGKPRLRGIGMLLLLLSTVVESASNFAMTGLYTTSRTDYLEDVEDIRPLAAMQKELDPGFWRMEKYERQMKDENLLSSYPAASMFSSLINIDVADLFHAIGMEGGKNYYCYNGATPLFSAILSTKYFLTDDLNNDDPSRVKLAENGCWSLYENRYALSPAFLVDPSLRSIPEGETSIDRINAFARAVGAAEDLLEYGGVATSDGKEAKVTVDTDSRLFAEVENTSIPRIFVKKNGNTTEFSKTTHHYLLDLGYLKAGEMVSVRASNDEPVTLDWYRVNPEALERAYALLAKDQLTVTSVCDTGFSGTIQTDRDGLLAFGIPAEDGWNVYVDGKLKEKETFLDALLAIPLEVGYHTVEIRYQTPYFVEGLIITLLSIAILILIYFMDKRRHYEKIREKTGDPGTQLLRSDADGSRFPFSRGNLRTGDDRESSDLRD